MDDKTRNYFNKQKELNQKFSAMCDKIDQNIRKLSQAKETGELSDDMRKAGEREIANAISKLTKIGESVINLDAKAKFCDLLMLWKFYQAGTPIRSKEEENKQADMQINEIMREYNRQHYGTGKGR